MTYVAAFGFGWFASDLGREVQKYVVTIDKKLNSE